MSIATSHNQTEETPGPRRIRDFFYGKLGRCPYCMRWSAWGMALGWLAVAVAILFGGTPAFAVTLAIAIAFSALFVLHITSFTARVLPAPETGINVQRRQFLTASLQVGAVAFAAAFGDPVLRGLALAGGREPDRGNSLCARLCQALFPPGPERGRCISDGAHGIGICFQGTCVPAPSSSSPFKPKQTRDAKLQALLNDNPTSSSLAGNFFQTARRFLANQAPANSLETAMFPAFARLSESTQQILRCAVSRFDALPRGDRVALFGEPFADPQLPPIAIDDLSRSLGHELQTLLLADPAVARFCDPETPGLVRPVTYVEVIEGGTFTVPVPWIDRIDDRRTKAFITEGGGHLALADYTEDEIDQACHPDPSGPICEVRSVPCPADAAGFQGPPYAVDDVCLRVGTVVAGTTVTLEGLNFYDVDARVRLFSTLDSREVEARVCGDIETPLTDAGGAVIADSRVKDFVGFTVPADMADGIYEVAVVVTNSSDGMEYVTPFGYRPYIRVLAPFTGSFEITSERLRCNTETGLTSFGSDEVGIRIISTPLLLGQVMPEPTRRDFRFDDVDSGENREMISTDGSRQLLAVHSSADLIGVIVTIAGFEVDNERAYVEEINDFWDLYVHFLAEEMKFLAAVLGPIALWFGVNDVAALIAAHPIIAAIAGAIALAIPIFIALWAPADPIIQDSIALSMADLLEMTSVSFPAPFGPPYGTPVTYSHGIDVEVIEVEKAPGQLREQRRYRSSEEDSTYTLTLRYNRAPAVQARTAGFQTASTGMLGARDGASLEVERVASSPPFTFHWQAAAGRSGDPQAIRIYDVAGRLRAQVRTGSAAAGSTLWDGNDSHGESLPAGVYFAVLSGPKTEARTRIVLVR